MANTYSRHCRPNLLGESASHGQIELNFLSHFELILGSEFAKATEMKGENVDNMLIDGCEEDEPEQRSAIPDEFNPNYLKAYYGKRCSLYLFAFILN